MKDIKMQKERLIIKNFFTLKDVDIELGKYNVFIGEQASGKSLLLKLIYFFRNVLRVPIYSYANSEDDIRLYVYNYFQQLFRVDYGPNDDLSIEYHYNEYLISVKSEEGRIIFICSDNLMQLYDDSRQYITRISQQTPEAPNLNLKQGVIQSNIVDILERSDLKAVNSPLFFPAGRMFLVSLQRNIFNMINSINADSKLPSIDPLILLFGQQYQTAIEYFGQTSKEYIQTMHKDGQIKFFDNLFMAILKGKFVYDQLGGFIQQNSGAVRSWHSSSGQQETLPIYLVLRNYLLSSQPSHLYIEEPEAHLYPSAQKAITELLVYVTNVTSSDGLYITTHSPYILTVLNNLILANDVKDKQTLFDKDLLISFEEVRAYYITDGGARDLRDYENRLILADNLDKVSEQTALDFDKLLDLKYE
ncbi:MAG: hypothetical protein EKK54_02325 [Neisseriaceae bacterium]|nr:MAG: hypothetical protein EKK54_02325 [Neisseriaceae bacterium]